MKNPKYFSVLAKTVAHNNHPLTLVCVHYFGISVEVPLETHAKRSWKCVQVNKHQCSIVNFDVCVVINFDFSFQFVL